MQQYLVRVCHLRKTAEGNLTTSYVRVDEERGSVVSQLVKRIVEYHDNPSPRLDINETENRKEEREWNSSRCLMYYRAVPTNILKFSLVPLTFRNRASYIYIYIYIYI
jgi:hypothetical protein